ncbi:MAG: PQQ-binding-like beta-propeller repeat protein [Sedimentisphaerales bacterium]|nr:PQQ-binding-like beta-propeller repeat protein [Sedimentisphaerales bacterium]MBN2843806.1 PQQ-binding-like beta-propeller repeat protein [Sedimentisphaerales bacterium]
MAGAKIDTVGRNSMLAMIISVVLILISGYFLLFGQVLETKSDVFENQSFELAKEQLRNDPANQQLQWMVRELDRRLRNDYIYGRELVDTARYLLVLAVLSFVISARIYVLTRYRPLVPQEQGSDSEYYQSRNLSAKTMMAFSGSLLLLYGGYLIWQVSGDPDSIEQSSANVSAIEADDYASPETLRLNWHRFRGFGGSGRVTFADIPLEFDLQSGKNIAWSIETELPGFNSPIIFGDKFFYAGANELVRKVYCHDLTSGSLVWQAQVDVAVRASETPPDVMEDTGYAAPTMATDGVRVYSIFANGDAACHDFEGKQLWAVNLGLPESTYGYAASLDTWQGGVIIQFDHGYDDAQSISELISLDGKTGKDRWRVKRPVINSWTSPILEFTAGKWQYITVSNPWVIAYDPATGTELWRFGGMHGDTAPSPVVAGDMTFGISPFDSIQAINTGLSGDISDSGLLWKGEDGIPDTTSPVVSQDKLWLLNMGSLVCYNLADGTLAYDFSVEGSFYSSPSLAGENKMIIMNMEGKYTLLSVENDPEVLYETSLGEMVCSSPAFAPGKMLIRSVSKIVCVSAR